MINQMVSGSCNPELKAAYDLFAIVDTLLFPIPITMDVGFFLYSYNFCWTLLFY